jgi:arsenate reductase
MSLVIYHNPRCSKSRQTLQILQDRRVEPEIVEYLKEPPTAERVLELAGLLGLPVHGLLRPKEAAYAERGLGPDDADADLAAAVAEEPSLLERPIVVSGERAVIGRPPETVLELL